MKVKVILIISIVSLFIAVWQQSSAETIETTEQVAGGDITYRVNVPYTQVASAPDPSDMSIFWTGRVTPSDNYVDVRMIHNDDKLFVLVHVFDNNAYTQNNVAQNQLTQWDSASLYIRPTGPSGTTPSQNAYQFVGMFNQNPGGSPEQYKTAYKGNGTNWVQNDSIPFETSSGGLTGDFTDPGDSRPLIRQNARGWWLSFRVPYDSIGVGGRPPNGTTWSVALRVYDRDDDSNSASGPNRIWPPGVNTTQPVTWGELHFGEATYNPPPIAVQGSTTIRHGVNGATVTDAMVGGGTEYCNLGGTAGDDAFEDWGPLNYDGATQINIQNQFNLADWPCFSKVYIKFPTDPIPAGKEIVSAELVMYHFGNAGPFEDCVTNGASRDFCHGKLQVLKVTQNWNESNIGWNNAPMAIENIDSTYVEWIPPGQPNGYTEEVRWDVSGVVAEAYANGEDVNLALYSADNNQHSGKYFNSSDVVFAPETRPKLVVRWGDNIPIDYDEFAYLPMIQR